MATPDNYVRINRLSEGDYWINNMHVTLTKLDFAGACDAATYVAEQAEIQEGKVASCRAKLADSINKLALLNKLTAELITVSDTLAPTRTIYLVQDLSVSTVVPTASAMDCVATGLWQLSPEKVTLLEPLPADFVEAYVGGFEAQ